MFLCGAYIGKFTPHFFDSYSANTQNINVTTLKINVIIIYNHIYEVSIIIFVTFLRKVLFTKQHLYITFLSLSLYIYIHIYYVYVLYMYIYIQHTYTCFAENKWCHQSAESTTCWALPIYINIYMFIKYISFFNLNIYIFLKTFFYT